MIKFETEKRTDGRRGVQLSRKGAEARHAFRDAVDARCGLRADEVAVGDKLASGSGGWYLVAALEYTAPTVRIIDTLGRATRVRAGKRVQRWQPEVVAEVEAEIVAKYGDVARLV